MNKISWKFNQNAVILKCKCIWKCRRQMSVSCSNLSVSVMSNLGYVNGPKLFIIQPTTSPTVMTGAFITRINIKVECQSKCQPWTASCLRLGHWVGLSGWHCGNLMGNMVMGTCCYVTTAADHGNHAHNLVLLWFGTRKFYSYSSWLLHWNWAIIIYMIARAWGQPSAYFMGYIITILFSGICAVLLS